MIRGGIDDLVLFDANSIRILKENGINSLKRLFSMSTNELMNVPNLGTRRVQKIMAYKRYKEQEAHDLGKHRTPTDIGVNYIIHTINTNEKEQVLSFSRDAEWVLKAILSLDVENQELLKLRFFEFNSFKDIGEKLQRDKTSVVFNINKRLKVILQSVLMTRG